VTLRSQFRQEAPRDGIASNHAEAQGTVREGVVPARAYACEGIRHFRCWLKKICKRRDIPTPGLGYWAKVAHGKIVRRIPLPPAKPEQSDVIVIYGCSEYGAPHVSSEAEADWVERDSQPEYRVTANFTYEYRHPLVLATAERLRKEKSEGGWLVVPRKPSVSVLNPRRILTRTTSSN
jgi:hypothetical protein